MKKLLLPVLLVLTILLSACNAGGKSAEATAAPTAAPTEATASGGEQTAGGATITSDTNPCVPFNIFDAIFPNKVAGLPDVSQNEWIKGSQDAPITIIVYSDLLCSHCATREKTFNQLLDLYPEDIKLVFRHWVVFRQNDILGAQAAEAAGLQGKFFEFADILFENQAEWGSLDAPTLESWLIEKAEKIGLDSAKFKEDLSNLEIVQKIEDAQSSGNKLGFDGTPTVIINGAKFEQSPDIKTFSMVMRLIKFESSHYSSCPEMVIDESKMYSAVISTTKGDIVIDLFADKAPYAVNSFVFLAREGWYNNLPIISTDQFFLSGDPTDTGNGGPGYAYKDEIDSTLNFNEPGMLASYGVGAGLNGSTFFINKLALTGQEGRTIFGKVTSGLDVLEKIEIRGNIFDPSLDTLLSVSITEK